MLAKAAEDLGNWEVAIDHWDRSLTLAASAGTCLKAAEERRVRWLRELYRSTEAMCLPAHIEPGALWIIEGGVDPAVAGFYLSRGSPGRVVAERPAAGLTVGDFAAEDIKSLISVGGARDVELASVARQCGDDVFDAVVARLPEDLRYRRGIDLGETARYDFWSTVFRQLRTVDGMAEVLRLTDSPQVVFLRGDGRLIRLLRTIATQRFGDRSVVEIDAAVQRPPGDSRHDHAGVGVPDVQGHEVRQRKSPETLPQARERAVLGAPCLIAWPVERYVSALAPVAEALAESGTVNVLALGTRSREKELLSPYHDLSRRESSVALHAMMLPTQSQPGPMPGDSANVDPIDISAIVGNILADLGKFSGPLNEFSRVGALEPLGEQVDLEVQRILSVDLPRIHQFADDLWAYFKATEPSVLVLTRDRIAFDRIAISTAKALDVPTVVIQPVLMSDNPMYNPLEADTALVFDSYARDLYMRSFDARPDQIVVTGMARFDPILPTSEVEAEEERPDGLILLAMQLSSSEESAALIQAVAAAADGVGTSAHVLVRPHPRSPRSVLAHYRDVAAQCANAKNIRVSGEGNIQELIRASDVVISGWSNTLLEAALLGRPALSLTLTDDELPIPLEEMGIVYSVRSHRELVESLPSLMRGGSLRDEVLRGQKSYLAENPHLADRIPARDRIAKEIRRLGSRSHRQDVASGPS